MTLRSLLAFAIATASAGALQAGGAIPAMPGVRNPERARQNFILKCQGCHRADAGGDARSTPAMAGMIGKFLYVKGGREFLIRVPGMSTAVLDDAQLAELANYMLYRFDPANVPVDFRPYSALEVAKLRKFPLRTDAAKMRASLIARMKANQDEKPQGAKHRGDKT